MTNHQKTKVNRSKLGKLGILSTVLPAIALASGMAASTVYADDMKDKAKSEMKAAGEAVSDGWITTKVKSKLVADRDVAGLDISVETDDQVVHLSGEVENQSQVSRAVEIAKDTEGVKRVDSTKLRLGTAVEQVKDAVDGKS